MTAVTSKSITQNKIKMTKISRFGLFFCTLIFINSVSAITSRVDISILDQNGQSRVNVTLAESAFSIALKSYVKCEEGYGSGTYQFRVELINPKGVTIDSFVSPYGSLPDSGNHIIDYVFKNQVLTSKLLETGNYRIKASFEEKYPQRSSPLIQYSEQNVQVNAQSAKDTLATWQVQLLVPANKKVLTNPRPFFQWIPAVTARKYNIYVSERADDPRLAPLWKAEGVVNTVIQYPNDVNPLIRGKRYYWQVVGFDQTGRQLGGSSGGSEIFEFVLGWDDAQKLTLVSPIEEFEIEQDLFKFEWVELHGNQRYKIQLSEASDFSQIEKIVWEGVSETSGVPYPLSAKTLQKGRTYFWRVSVENDGFGLPNRSNIGNFKYMVDHRPEIIIPEIPKGGSGIKGKIFDQTGKPLMAASITASGPLADTTRFAVHSIGSNQDGHYELPLVYGLYDLNIARVGFNPLILQIEIRNGEIQTKDFKLISSRSIFAGQVIHSITGKGIANANVTLKNTFYDVEYKTDEDGNFAFNNLREGAYTAEVSQFPFFKKQTVALNISSTTSKQKIYLEPVGTGTISGLITEGAKKTPIGFAEINIKNIEPKYENSMGLSEAKPQIFNMGRFEQTNLSPGIYQIVIKSPYLPAVTKKVAVEGGGVSNVEFNLDAEKFKISGIAKKADGSIIQNAMINFPGFTGLGNCFSDSTGKFECEVYSGEYDLRIQYPGYTEKIIKVNVKNDVSIGEVLLTQKTEQLKILVVDSSGIPITGINAEVQLNSKTEKFSSDSSGNFPAITAAVWTNVTVNLQDPNGKYEKQVQSFRIQPNGVDSIRKVTLRKMFEIKGIVQNQSREPLAGAIIWVAGTGYEVASRPDGSFSLFLPEILPVPSSIDILVKRAEYFTEKRTVMTELLSQEVIVRLRNEKEKATSFTSVRINNSVREIRSELDDVEAWIKRTVAKILEDLEETRKAMLAYKKVIDEKTKRINEIKAQLLLELEKPYVSANALRLSVELKSINEETKLLTEAMSSKVLAQLDSIERFINLFKRAVDLRLPVIDIKLEDLLDSVIQSPFLEENVRANLQASVQALRLRFENEVKEFYRVKSIEIDELFARIGGEIKGTLFEIIDIQNRNTAIVDDFVARIEKDIEAKQNAEKNRVAQVISMLPENKSKISETQQIVIRFDKSIDIDSVEISGNWFQNSLLIWSGESRDNDTLKIMPSPKWPYGNGEFSLIAKDVYGKVVVFENENDNSQLGFTFSYVSTPQNEVIDVDTRPDNLPESPSSCPEFAPDCVDLTNPNELKLAQKISEIQSQAMAIRNKLILGVNEIDSMQVMLKDFYNRAAIVDSNLSKLAEAIRRIDNSTETLISQIKNVKEYIKNWEYSFELKEIGGFKVRLLLSRNQSDPKKLDVFGTLYVDNEVLGNGWKIELKKFTFDLSEVMDAQVLEFRKILYGAHQYLQDAAKQEEYWRLVNEYNASEVNKLFPKSLVEFDGQFLPRNLRNPGNFAENVPAPLRNFDPQKIFSSNLAEFNLSSLSDYEKEVILKSDAYAYSYNSLTPFLKEIVPDTRPKLDELKNDFLINKYMPQDIRSIYKTAKTGDGDALLKLFETYLPRDLIDAYEAATKTSFNYEMLYKANFDNQGASDFVRLFLPEKLRQNLPTDFFVMTWEDVAPDFIKNFNPVELTELAKIKFIEKVLDSAIVEGELNLKLIVLRNIKIGYITKEKARSNPAFAKYEQQAYLQADTSLDFGMDGLFDWGNENLPKVDVGNIFYYGKGASSADEVSITLPRPMGPVIAGFGLKLKTLKHSLKKKWFSFGGELYLGMTKDSPETKVIQLQEFRMDKSARDVYELTKLSLNLSPPVDMYGMQLESFSYDKNQKLFDFSGKLVNLGSEKEGWSFKLSRIWFQNGGFRGAEAQDLIFGMGRDSTLSLKIKKISVEYVADNFDKYYYLQVTDAALEIKAKAPDLETIISISKLDVKWYKSEKPDIQFENLSFGLPTIEVGILRITINRILLSYKPIDGQKRYDLRLTVTIEIGQSGGSSGASGAFTPTIRFVENKKPEFLAFKFKLETSGISLAGTLENKQQYFYAQVEAKSPLGLFKGEYYDEYRSKDWFVSVHLEVKPCIPVAAAYPIPVELSICGGGLKYGSRGGDVVVGGTVALSITTGASLEYFRGTVQLTYIAGEKLIQFGGQGQVLPYLEENVGISLGNGFFEVALSMGEQKYIDVFAQFNMPQILAITPKFLATLDFYLDKDYVKGGISAGMMAQQEFEGGGGGLKLGVNLGTRVGLKFKKKAPVSLPIQFRGGSYRPPREITAGYVFFLDAYASLQLNKVFAVPGFRGGITAQAQVVIAYDYGEPQFGAGMYFYVAGSASLYGVGASLALVLDAGGQVGKKSVYVSAAVGVQACVQVSSMQKCFNGDARITLGKPPYELPKKVAMCEPVPMGRMNVFVADKFGVPLKNATVKLSPKNSSVSALMKGEGQGECGDEFKSGLERFLEDPGAAIQNQIDADIEKAKKVLGDLGSGKQIEECKAKLQKEIQNQTEQFKQGIDSAAKDLLDKTDVQAQMKTAQRNLKTKMKELEGSIKEKFQNLDKQMVNQLKNEIDEMAQACVNHIKDTSADMTNGGAGENKAKESEENPCDIDLEALIAGAKGEGNYAEKFVNNKITETTGEVNGLVTATVADLEKMFDVEAAFKQAEDSVRAQIDTAIAGVQAQVDQCITDMTSGINDLNTIAGEYSTDPLSRVINGTGSSGSASQDNPFEGTVSPSGRWRSGVIPLYEEYTIDVQDASGLYAMSKIFGSDGNGTTSDNGGLDVETNESASTIMFSVVEQGVKVEMGPGELVRDVLVHVNTDQGEAICQSVKVYLVNNNTGEKLSTTTKLLSEWEPFESESSAPPDYCNDSSKDKPPSGPSNGQYAYFSQVFSDWDATIRALPEQGTQYGQSSPVSAKVKSMKGFQGKKKIAEVKVVLPMGKTFWEAKVLSNEKPVKNATVTLSPSPSTKNPDTTFEDGTFYFNGLEVKKPYTVTVEAQNFAKYTETITLNSTEPHKKNIHIDRKISEVSLTVKGPAGDVVLGSSYNLVRNDKPNGRQTILVSNSGTAKINLEEGFVYSLEPEQSSIINIKSTGPAKLDPAGRGIIRIDYSKGGNFGIDIIEQNGPGICFNLSSRDGNLLELNQNELKMKINNSGVAQFVLLTGSKIPASLKTGECSSANHAIYLPGEIIPRADQYSIQLLIEKTGMSTTETSHKAARNQMSVNLGSIKVDSSNAPVDHLRGREIMAGKFKFKIGQNVNELNESPSVSSRRVYSVDGTLFPIGNEVTDTADVEKLIVEAWLDKSGEFKYEVQSKEICSVNCSTSTAKITNNRMNFNFAGLRAKVVNPNFELVSGTTHSAVALMIDSATKIPQLVATTPIELSLSDVQAMVIDRNGKPSPQISSNSKLPFKITGGGNAMQTSDGVPIQLKQDRGIEIQRTSGNYTITFNGNLMYDGQDAGDISITYDTGSSLSISPQNAKTIILKAREFIYQGAPTRLVSTAFVSGQQSPDWSLEVSVYDEKTRSYSKDKAIKIKNIKFENGQPKVLDRTSCELININDSGELNLSTAKSKILIKKESLKGEWYTNFNKCVFSGEGSVQ